MADSPDNLEPGTGENKPHVRMGYKFWMIVGFFYLSLLIMLMIVLVIMLLKS